MSDTADSSGVAKAAASSDVLERGRRLVSAAFDEARSSGREEWYLMTTAVLKNRLLNITNREFSESAFGVSSMVQFARLFPEDLAVDTQNWPPMIQFMGSEAFPAPPAKDRDSMGRSVPHKKIRPDLWRAVVDYRSGLTYVWDEMAGSAREASIDDTSPVVPRVTEADVAGWRQEFADSVKSGLNWEKVAERLNEWLARGYGAGFLPAELRGRWNGFFRDKVEMRLLKFFEDHGRTPPDDLVTASDDQSAGAAGSAKFDRSTNVPPLRAFVQRCVAVMTEQELTELRISPAVMLRATRGRS